MALLAAAPDDPLSADGLRIMSVEATADGQAVIEVVAPLTEASTVVAPAMFAVDGGRVTSVEPVTATDVTIAVVLDDRPTVGDDVLVAEQGSAVELIRNLRAGTTVGVSTPGGIRSEPTTDRRANIAVVAGLETGPAPLATLTETATAAAAALGRSRSPDRHLVVFTGHPTRASNLELAALALRLTDGGIRLSVVDVGDRADRRLREVADTRGPDPLDGSPPTGAINAIDAVTAFIDNRYLVTADLAGDGPHTMTLSVGGTKYSGAVELESSLPSEPTTDGTIAASPPTRLMPPVSSNAGASSAASTARPTTPTSVSPTTEGELVLSVTEGGDDGPPMGRLLPMAGAAAAVAAVIAVAVRRRRRAEEEFGYGYR